MSIPRISGQQARELLDAWANDGAALRDAREDARHGFGDLFASAPALAETVAWLYGREIDDIERGFRLTPGGAVAVEPDMVVSEVGTFTPDEAVDLARALLSAAEEARRG